MKLRRLFATCMGAALALTPAACARPGPEITPTPVSTVTATATPRSSPQPDPPLSTAPLTQTPPATDPVDTEVPIEQEPPPTTCQLAQLDLVESAFGAWLNSQIIPTTEAGSSYYFEVVNNQFNPCEELSWVRLEGQNTNDDSSRGSVIFFNYEQLITDPLPVQFPAVTSVERIDGSALEVSYSSLVSPGNPEKFPVHYRMSGAQLRGDAEIPAEFDANPRLDFSHAGPPGVGNFRPFGNANFRPWDHERPMWNQYAIMMGDERINCDFPSYNGEQLTCYDEYSDPWPLLTEDFETVPGESANIARMNFRAPWQVVTSMGNPPAIKAEYELLPENATTRVGNFFIQTYSDVIIIHDVNWAYRLGEGIAEPVEVPSFQTDISRHPQDLIPWEG